MSRFVLLGHPVTHSLSPAIHAAAHGALGLSHSYELLDCPDAAALASAIDRIRSGELAGANVTVPYKERALELADESDGSARETEAANVLALVDGRVTAFNTDVSALAEELGLLAPGATSAVVFGAGGAARAAVRACELGGITELAVVARRFKDDAPAASGEWPRTSGAMTARRLPWPVNPHARSLLFDAISQADVLIQATSAGMTGGPPGLDVSAIIPWDAVPTSALAYDVVYTPAVTPFLEAARVRGLGASGGLGMLVGQAALAFRIWLGVEPPRSVMARAARAALTARGSDGP
ncbi:MAG: shikimate dehydrogenase [Myxococcales bacterium]|nr:shikimate dehydrogenase [Myxococcales bacterium]